MIFGLLVLDQCMFTALLYGAEAWGDISIIEDEIQNIEIKALKSILKVKQSTSNDLIFFELGRANIISRIKDLQFKFYNKISKLQHDQAIVKYIVDLCANEDIILYYHCLHGHHQDDDRNIRRDLILHSDKSMTMYYRSITTLTKPCLYSSYLPDYFRFIIT